MYFGILSLWYPLHLFFHLPDCGLVISHTIKRLKVSKIISITDHISHFRAWTLFLVLSGTMKTMFWLGFGSARFDLAFCIASLLVLCSSSNHTLLQDCYIEASITSGRVSFQGHLGWLTGYLARMEKIDLSMIVVICKPLSLWWFLFFAFPFASYFPDWFYYLILFGSRLVAKTTQLEGEKKQKETEVQKLMEENVRLSALLDKKEAQLLAMNEQYKLMALSSSNI